MTRNWLDALCGHNRTGHDAAGRACLSHRILIASVALGAKLIGINNRDLRTFETDLEHTVRLRSKIPTDRVVVGESGIRTHADVELLEAAGVGAMLVGESLMREPDLGAAVDGLLGNR